MTVAVDVQLHGPRAASEFAERVWPCYRDVFGDFDDIATWRDDMFGRHAARDGYRLAVALDGPLAAGFSWGYVGQRGQYWPAAARHRSGSEKRGAGPRSYASGQTVGVHRHLEGESRP